MKVSALVLAAGASRRLGRAKQLLRWQGESLVRRSARMALAAGYSPVRVVQGAVALGAELEGLDLELLENPAWEEGLGSSLRRGAEAWSPDETGLLVLACDQPALCLELLQRLRESFEPAPTQPCCSTYGETRGLPAILPLRLREALLALKGDRGAKALLMGPETRFVAFPDGEADLDTPEDLQRWGID